MTGAAGTNYEGETFQLQFKFGPRYPFDSPQVSVTTTWYIPHIDLDVQNLVYHCFIDIRWFNHSAHLSLSHRRFCHIIIIKLYCHIQRTLHDELECSLALTHIVPIYTIK